MKYLFLIVVVLFSFAGKGQDTTKFGHLKHLFDISWSNSILFSTDNPWGAGHLDWGLTKDTIRMDVVSGGSVLKGGKVVKSYMWRTDKPFLFMDTTDMAAYDFESYRNAPEGSSITLIWSDGPIKDFTALVLGFGKKEKVLTIYDVVHFW